VTWILAAVALVGSIVGLAVCALFLRLGLVRGDWLLVMGALLTTGALLYAVFWMKGAL
jgi:hypothetical protein